MDNKTILQFIKKDLEELRILVEELENAEQQEQLLIDITAAKAKTLLQEFSLLKASAINTVLTPAHVVAIVSEDEPVSEVDHTGVVVEAVENELQEAIADEPTNKDEEICEDVSALEDDASKIVSPENEIFPFDNAANHFEIIEETIVVQPEPESVVVEEQLHVEEILDEETEPVDEVTEVIENEIIEAEPVQNEDEATEEEAVAEGQVITRDTNETNLLIEPEPNTSSKKVFGEQFTKEPSLNDRLSSMKNTEPKIKAQPISNLKTAIGLNDRFMFTRELFANSSERYEAAINAIDNANNIVEAVEYLEQNFKWQKTDVSLKFIGLVKRRFEK